MKNVLILMALGLMFNDVSGQLNLKIFELNLSHISSKLNENIIDEDLESGPYVDFICVFENNSDSSITLYPSVSKTNLSFRYKGKDYYTEVIPLPFVDKEILVIIPKQKIEFSFGTYLLLGTSILTKNQEDYTKEMLVILPTLKVKYKDKATDIQANEVINVTLQ